MPLTADLIAADYAYWCPSPLWNGTDAPGTGTAIGVDYALYRGCNDRSAANITQFNAGYDATGAYGSQNQAFQASTTKHNSDGTRLEWFNEYQRPAGQRILCAIAYANPTVPSGDPLAGLTMLDTGMIAALWPLQYVNQDWILTGGSYVQTTVPSTDPNYRGFPTLSNFGNGTHTCTFWLKETLHAFVLLLQSPFASVVSPHYGITYAAVIANALPTLLGIVRWLLYGGSASYVIPSSPNGDGSWTGGVKQAADDAQDAGLTHRRACEAVTYVLMWYLRGQTDADLIWWAGNYAGITLDNQDAAGFFYENVRTGVDGEDSTYTATTLTALRNCFILWPASNPDLQQSAIHIGLNDGTAWEASTIFAAAGVDPNGVSFVANTVNISSKSRVNPFAPSSGLYAGQVTGYPVVPLTGGGFLWTGEGQQGAGDSNAYIPKVPDYAGIFEALNAWGYFAQFLTGSDAGGWQGVGTGVAQVSAWAAYGTFGDGSAPIIINRRQARLFRYTCTIVRPAKPVPDPTTLDNGPGVPSIIASGVPCFYEYTPNLDDPTEVGRFKRPTEFTTDIVHFATGTNVQNGDYLVNTTMGNPNYGATHVLLGAARNMPNQDRRRTNTMAFDAQVLEHAGAAIVALVPIATV